jgi:curli production assembly/transport component CsgG/holdfast attachment protein HfaB
VGGITELNFNIRSENANGTGGGTRTNATTGTAAGSLYVMNVGLDMRLVNTNTLEVADVISYQKQIIGRQISAGVFDFLGTNFFDVSLGESALEPIQLAVRSVIERATLEMITRIYRAPGQACAIPLGTNDDPLRDAAEYYPQTAYAGPEPYAPPQPAYYAPPSYQMSQGDAGRGSPYRGYHDPDPGLINLRGGL